MNDLLAGARRLFHSITQKEDTETDDATTKFPSNWLLFHTPRFPPHGNIGEKLPLVRLDMAHSSIAAPN
jgi:hypothetical protein